MSYFYRKSLNWTSNDSKVEKYWACLSLGIICVDIGSTCNFNFFATYFSTLGSILAKVPTAPEIAQVEISLIEFSKRFYFLKILGRTLTFSIQMLLALHRSIFLPIHNVYLCFIAWFLIDWSNWSISFNKISQIVLIEDWSMYLKHLICHSFINILHLLNLFL